MLGLVGVQQGVTVRVCSERQPHFIEHTTVFDGKNMQSHARDCTNLVVVSSISAGKEAILFPLYSQQPIVRLLLTL